MEEKTNYAKQQEEKHKRKIILPNCISWEYGSNKFASQKGQSAFGTIRNTKPNNDSDVQYWKKNGVVYYHYEQATTVDEGAQRSLNKKDEASKTASPPTSVPRYQAQHTTESNDDQYKAWIGGQTTTYTTAPAYKP